MSYCRFSSDNFRSDVYCYYSVGDFFAVMVAGHRHVSETPPPDISGWWNLPPEEGLALYQTQQEWLDKATLEPIGLSRDGMTFDIGGADEAADLLEDLRKEGYCVPQFAIDALREEAKEDTP